jgi:hypothetical protein
MKTTIDLPDELVREVKLRALIQGRTLRDLVTEFIRQGLGLSALNTPEGPLPGSKVKVGANGLPVIPCHADAPAVGMSADDLLQLEQQVQTVEDTRDARRPV